MSETEDTVETPYGRLDRAALTQARESYDTAGLLRTVGELDEWIATVQGEDGLADLLLRLHSMARTVMNGAPMDVAGGEETLPDLALDLTMDLEEAIARLQEWGQRIEPLEALAARD
jgi:hypothetical protein